MTISTQKSNLIKLGEFIDLTRYPIDQLDSDAGLTLVQQCHQMMTAETICALPGFLTPAATEALAWEINALTNVVRKINFQATPYGWIDNSGFPQQHPRSRLFPRHCGVLTTEQLDPDGLCLRLFRFDALTEFVRRLLRYDVLYRSACPNISVRLNIMEAGDEFGWHYDTNDGVVSLTTQNADAGGLFEYAPLIRSEQDENYDAVDRIMRGIDQPRRPQTPAGTFTLFMGRRSLHLVSKIQHSENSRQSLLFSYDRKPDMVFPERIRKRMTEPSDQPFLGTRTPTE